MEYKKLVEVYEKLEKTTKRLEKRDIIAGILGECKEDELDKIIYLLQGRVFPQFDERKIGMSSRLILKVISKVSGETVNGVERQWKKIGDLGEVTSFLVQKKKQSTLRSSSKLTIHKVFDNLLKISELEGEGTVNKKIDLVSELIANASPVEAKFIVRTVLEDLRIGVAEGVLRDAIALAYNVDVKAVEKAFNVLVDYGEVAGRAKEKKLGELELVIGRPFKVMLAIKVNNIEEAFDEVGKPALWEFKMDGFRVTIHKNNDEIKLFTRKMEDVTKQFPEVIDLIKENVKAKKGILDSEFVGYDKKIGKYLPFQNISQRIKRKYDIESIAKKFPVEINVFDILNYEGKYLKNEKQLERRKLLEKTIKEKDKKIVLTKKLITDDVSKAKEFFEESLKAGNEGLIAKKIDAIYQPGRRVEGWVKLKSVMENLDLAIIGAEWGTGKRAGFLSSFVLGCKKGNEFLECGMIGTGIKEKSKEGVSFKQLTKLLKPLINKEEGRKVKIKPKIIIEVRYEEIQKSPTYNSGYALRFPRVIRLRNDKPIGEIADLKQIEKLYKGQ
ncbi:ATP-dependent DNA ligase [Candidatus Woesearchaeota archaeon]|nr:ATP-dependent DNA ligase [Candidatus Woesearchaeota archaeon]